MLNLNKEEKAEARKKPSSEPKTKHTTGMAQRKTALKKESKNSNNGQMTLLAPKIMKPRTKIQKEVFALSKRLPKISEIQTKYAFRHSFEHVGSGLPKVLILPHRVDTNGRETEHWQTRFGGCTCPHCRTELKVHTTRKEYSKEMNYFSHYYGLQRLPSDAVLLCKGLLQGRTTC